MTTANIKIPFESIDYKTYIKYIEQAELLQEKGLLLDESIVQLAKQLYEKGINNENKLD